MKASVQMGRYATLTALGLLGALGIAATMAALAVRGLSALTESRAWVEHTHEVVETGQEALLAVERAVTARRAFALTGDEAGLAAYREAVRALAAARAR